MAQPQDNPALHVDIPRLKIPRKPISPSSKWVGLPPGLEETKNLTPPSDIRGPSSAATLVDDLQQTYFDETQKPPLPLRPSETQLTGSTLSPGSDVEQLPSPDSAGPTGPSKFAKAWEETKYFAGGLISHPFESTKHYSVLRHSHGLVYYQGSETSVAVSIFADGPLPNDRKIWLQQKGWTGKTGLKAKQLFGANGGWLDVTPSIQATAEQLPKSCERAWQRDCKKFLQKDGSKKAHVLTETCIVRIPCEAEDGYFRLVLCHGVNGKRILCPSPVFRVISVSTTPSSMRGASLRTLPLEAGIKVFSIVANNMAWSAAQPLTTTVQNTVGRYLPNFWETQAASAAYKVSGLNDKITNTNTNYQDKRDTSYQHVGGVDEIVYDALDGAPVIGGPEGPVAPYPISISSMIVPGTGGHSSQANGTPTANLKFVREEVTMSLQGIYFGWARITPSKNLAKQVDGQENAFFPMWHPTLIYVGIVHDVAFTVTYGAQKTVSAFLIYEFGSTDMTDCRIELIIMGFLREYARPSKLGESAEERVKQDADNRIADIAIAQASLSRPSWSIETIYENNGGALREGEIDRQGKMKKLSESMAERYIDARQAAQRQADRVPVHLLGVRRDVDVLKEKTLGTGGIFVSR